MLHAAKWSPSIFTESLTHSVIVGYNTKTVSTANYQEMVGAQFNSVGAEALDIQDITLVGDSADGTAWIKWWDPKTRTYSEQAVYTATLVNPDDDTDLTYGGWGDQINWYPVTKTFAPGEGFWFSPAIDGVGITIAGAVEKTGNEYVGRTVTTANQQMMVINAFPTALNIQDIVLDGDSKDGTAWIKWWDSETRTYSEQAVYTATLVNPDDDTDLTYGGWGDQINWYPITKTFKAGDGFWFSPSIDNVTICFPNPFYAAE